MFLEVAEYIIHLEVLAKSGAYCELVINKYSHNERMNGRMFIIVIILSFTVSNRGSINV